MVSLFGKPRGYDSHCRNFTPLTDGDLPFVLGEVSLSVASLPARAGLRLFAKGPSPRAAASTRTPLGLLRSFLEVVNRKDLQLANEKVSGLSHLCKEFLVGDDRLSLPPDRDRRRIVEVL
jgi:hypothetical protein